MRAEIDCETTPEEFVRLAKELSKRIQAEARVDALALRADAPRSPKARAAVARALTLRQSPPLRVVEQTPTTAVVQISLGRATAKVVARARQSGGSHLKIAGLKGTQPIWTLLLDAIKERRASSKLPRSPAVLARWKRWWKIMQDADAERVNAYDEGRDLGKWTTKDYQAAIASQDSGSEPDRKTVNKVREAGKLGLLPLDPTRLPGTPGTAH